MKNKATTDIDKVYWCSWFAINIFIYPLWFIQNFLPCFPIKHRWRINPASLSLLKIGVRLV